MEFIKLQIGCLIIDVYIIILYLKDTLNRKYPCNKNYDFLMIFTSWAIIFDGVTAWTVNHLDTVPLTLNLIFHFLFYLFMDLEIFFSLIYILEVTQEFPKRKRIKTLLFLPFVVAVFGILHFMKDTYFVHGKITNYSMGPSAVICYAMNFIYFSALFVFTVAKSKYIESKKRIGIFTVLIIILLSLILQIIFPEILITSITSSMILVGFYISIEDPALVKLKIHNNTMVTGFATLVENRDNSTGGHIIRTKAYVTLLLKKMKDEPRYKQILTKDYEQNIENAAPMHDIGKITTPDHILQKPGKLTDEEYAIMKNHALAGGEIIIDTFGKVDSPQFLKVAYDMARFHHEKWDGTGYPEGLAKTKIPLSARIMAIADVFDAVSAKRCYRDALPLETCFKIIQEGSGKDFDPDLVRIFMNSKDEVIKLFNEEW